MERHPLDECDAAKKLKAMADEAMASKARRVVEAADAGSYETAIDKIFENYSLDMTIMDTEFDDETGTLRIVASIVVPPEVKHIDLHLIKSSGDGEPCPECGGHH